MIRYAIVDVGLMPAQFWAMTFAEFQLVCESHAKHNNDWWRKVRWIGALFANVMRSKKSSIVRPERLLPLPDDQPETFDVMTRERFEYLRDLWKQKVN